MIKKIIYIVVFILTFANCIAKDYDTDNKIRLSNSIKSIKDYNDMYKLMVIYDENPNSLSNKEKILIIKYMKDLMNECNLFYKSDKLSKITENEYFRQYITNKTDKLKSSIIGYNYNEEKTEKEKQEIIRKNKEKEKQRIQEEKERKARALILRKQQEARELELKKQQEKDKKDKFYKETGANKQGYQLNGINVNNLHYNPKYDEMKDLQRDDTWRFVNGKLYLRMNSWDEPEYLRYKDLVVKKNIAIKIFELTDSKKESSTIEGLNGDVGISWGRNILDDKSSAWVKDGTSIEMYHIILKQVHKQNMKIINDLKKEKEQEVKNMKADKLRELLN